jgi:hypothetical protein
VEAYRVVNIRVINKLVYGDVVDTHNTVLYTSTLDRCATWIKKKIAVAAVSKIYAIRSIEGHDPCHPGCIHAEVVDGNNTICYSGSFDECITWARAKMLT